MVELRAPDKKDITLGAIAPNDATERAYRAELDRNIKRMCASYTWWIEQAYQRSLMQAQQNGNVVMAQDAADDDKSKGNTVNALYAELKRLDNYWSDNFSQLAVTLAKKTAKKWVRDNTLAWQNKLKRAGFTVDLRLTKKQKTFLTVKVRENVDLIKSIQSQYHTDVTGIVSRGFLAGRDLASISKNIKERYGVTTRRAALIARDQSNKATSQLNATRQQELGIVWAVWVHSSAGKEPRPYHAKAGREYWIYNIAKGIDFNDGFGHVLPGEAINCRCTGRSIIIALGRGLPDGRKFDPAKLVAVPGFDGAYRMAA